METEFLARRILKFGIVGVSGMILDFAVTYLMKEKLKVNRYYANAAGFLVAVTNNFLLNKIWTFADQNPDVAGQYLKFLIVSLAGLGLSTSIIWIAHGKMKLNFYVSKLTAVMLVMIWNFLANSFFTFL